MENQRFTAAGTDIEEVKQKNAQSGMSYNEVKEFLAKTIDTNSPNNYGTTDFKK